MGSIIDIFTSYYFLAFFFAWITGVLLKAVLAGVKSGKFSLSKGFNNGGMPSTHSIAVAAITTAIFIETGASEIFFVSLVFALVVISDAFGVRKNIGVQGDAINQILKSLKKDPIKVVIGHTFFQVSIGIIWGIGWAILIGFIV